MSFNNEQRKHVMNLIEDGEIFNGDSGSGIFRKTTHPFILQNSMKNLYSQYREAILAYFLNNKISWWNGRLTNHPLSSQIACLNHLFPIRENKNAVLSLVKSICPDIKDVLTITSDTYKPAYIQFESISDKDHLNETYSTRGNNCTSIDALIYGELNDRRRILFPIEWKYVESYNNENKATGSKGETRKTRYTDLINKSSQLQSSNKNVYYYEPFYQLMRQTLWAEEIIKHKDTETLQADDFIHIHVIPPNNKELLEKIYPCSGKMMEDTWRGCLKDQKKYLIVSPKELLSSAVDALNPLFKYLEKRYW